MLYRSRGQGKVEHLRPHQEFGLLLSKQVSQWSSYPWEYVSLLERWWVQNVMVSHFSLLTLCSALIVTEKTDQASVDGENLSKTENLQINK